MEELIHDERLRHIEVVPVRVDDVTNCYATLREMDSRDDVRAKKYIVLDLSSDDALRRILKQVRAPVVIRSFVWPTAGEGGGGRQLRQIGGRSIAVSSAVL